MRWCLLLFVIPWGGCQAAPSAGGACALEGCPDCTAAPHAPGGISGKSLAYRYHWGHHSKYSRHFDDKKSKRLAKHHARSALREMGKMGRDFQYGFEQAYVDVALGASGDVPPLPPERYWKKKARTPQGHQRAQNWFAGYAAGAEQARVQYAHFNEVATSGAPGYEQTPQHQSLDASYQGGFQSGHPISY